MIPVNHGGLTADYNIFRQTDSPKQQSNVHKEVIMKFRLIAVCCIAVLCSSVRADIVPPTWGEVLYDSTFIDICVDDVATTVNIQSCVGVIKLVNDDYILTFNRDLRYGTIDEDGVEVEVADSLCRCDVVQNSLEFSYLSRVLFEDTLRFSVRARYSFPADEQGRSLSQLVYYLNMFTTSQDTVWENWLDPDFAGFTLIYGGDYFTQITANRELSAQKWERLGPGNYGWGDPESGQEIIFNDRRIWGDRLALLLAHRIEIIDNEGVADTLTDDMTYELTPEVRLEIPNLILDEDIRIELDGGGRPPSWHVRMTAVIMLEQDLARRLAPMWLWFPNDETDARVDLCGTFYWDWDGNSMWRRDSLEVREGHVQDQSGFFIRVPHLINPVDMDMDFWWWNDPELRVEVSEHHENIESARFILVTAPLDPSRVAFIIPRQYEFTRWDSPFDGVVQRDLDWRGKSLTFYGVCREPGIAQVWWQHRSGAPLMQQVPAEFAITSVFPNPFNVAAEITFSVSEPGRVSLTIIDNSGREVANLVNDRFNPGVYSRIFDAEDLSTGVYLARLTANNEVRTAKLVLMK